MKAYDLQLKRQARSLRQSGLSYGKIGIALNVAKSTAKLWCDGVVLNKKQKEKLYTVKINNLIRGENSSHRRRQSEIAQISKNAKAEIVLPVNNQSFKLMGAALYWAEGSKTNHFSIVNSDPILINFMVHWLNEVIGISPKDLKANLNIYPQQSEKAIIKYWSKITGIPVANFDKSYIKPLSSGYRKNNLYHGTIRIRTSKGSDLRHRVAGWINAVLKDEKINIEEEIVWNKKILRS